jgi:RNA polymerase sigma-70 factor (ECF subfamily)
MSDADPGPEILREYQSLVAQVQRAFRLGEDEATDKVHDAIVAVYGSFGNFDPAKGEFRGWLWGVLKHIRQTTKMPKPGPEPVEAGAPLEDLVVEEVGALIRASVEGLPEAYRKTMELRFYQGLALQDIAKQLAVPLGTVKARLSRASEMLRQSSAVQATTARLVLDRLKKKQK